MKIIIVLITFLFLTSCYVRPSEYTKICSYDYSYRERGQRTYRKVKICKICDGYSCWKEIRQIYR